jgi:hypothetical protein
MDNSSAITKNLILLVFITSSKVNSTSSSQIEEGVWTRRLIGTAVDACRSQQDTKQTRGQEVTVTSRPLLGQITCGKVTVTYFWYQCITLPPRGIDILLIKF